MLVLKRNLRERILIGPDIVIELTWVGERSAKLGIAAPPGVVILREELAGTPPREKRGES